jgi:8-oxo-dGTP pyrophosphatase MutT (NUDIX family)
MTLATSIKGVLLVEGGVVLVKNSRDEWELPGGRIESGETHESTLAREFDEELSLQVRVGAAIDSYVFEVVPGRRVRIVTYGCMLAGGFAPRISPEHSEYRVCPVNELDGLRLPTGYMQSIERWSRAVVHPKPLT